MSPLLRDTHAPRSLPRGRSRLPREVVLLSQRARLIEAVVDVVGMKGYTKATIGDVAAAARVSRTTFYEHFQDKEDGFLAAYEELSGRHLECVLTAAKQGGTPTACLQAGITAYLEVLADDPAYARVSMVEVSTAGRQAGIRREALHARYAALLGQWHRKLRAEEPSIPPMPAEVFECAIGGVAELVARQVRGGEVALPRLAPLIVTFLLNLGGAPAGRELAAALASVRTRPA